MTIRIVAAAIRIFESDLTISVPPPGRHHSVINGFAAYYGIRVEDRADRGWCPGDPTTHHHEHCQQGFLTSEGRFVDRIEAWRVADEAGQIIRRCGLDGPDASGLFSENLW